MTALPILPRITIPAEPEHFRERAQAAREAARIVNDWFAALVRDVEDHSPHHHQLSSELIDADALGDFVATCENIADGMEERQRDAKWRRR